MVIESVRGAAEAGMETIVALPAQGPLVQELQKAGAKVVVIPMLVLRKALMRPSGWPTLIRDSLRGLGAAWRLLGSVMPDVVYVSTLTLPQWPIVSAARRVPVLSHVHEAENSGNRVISSALYVPLLAARSILVNSRFSLQTLANRFPPLAKRAQVLYNGVSAPIDPRPPRALVDDALRILYVGRFSPRKGPDVIIDAATLLGRRGIPVDVSLLGSAFTGYEGYVQELKRKVKDAALSSQVHFLDFSPNIWDAMAAADVLVVPSRVDEPFGNTAVEGLLGLRPVVASDTSGLREAAGGYSTAWLVSPDDPAALADRLELLLSQWTAYISDVDVSRSRAYARHSVTTYRTAVAETLNSLSLRDTWRRRRGPTEALA